MRRRGRRSSPKRCQVRLCSTATQGHQQQRNNTHHLASTHSHHTLSLSLSDRASLKKGKAHLMSASDMEAGFGSCYGDTPDSTGESGLTVEVASSSASSTKTDGSRIFTMASFRDDVINAVTPVMRKMLLAHPFSLPQVHTKPSQAQRAQHASLHPSTSLPPPHAPPPPLHPSPPPLTPSLPLPTTIGECP